MIHPEKKRFKKNSSGISITKVTFDVTEEEYYELFNAFKATGSVSNGFLRKVIVGSFKIGFIEKAIILRVIKILSMLLVSDGFDKDEIQELLKYFKSKNKLN